MQIEKLLVLTLALAATAARAQSPSEADPLKAFQKVENAKSEELPPEVRATIINKPKIAEATLARVVGLREAGNPHIQRGTGLLLPDMKDDPSISHVDMKKLHDERVAMIENRRGNSHSHQVSSSAVHGAQSPAAAAAQEAAPERQQSYAGLLFAGASLLLTVAGGVYFWKTQKK